MFAIPRPQAPTTPAAATASTRVRIRAPLNTSSCDSLAARGRQATRQPVPPRAAHRINHSSATQRARPLSTLPQLLHSQPGTINQRTPLTKRAKTKLRRAAHKAKKLLLGGRAAAPSPERAQCACWHYPPEGWRFCRYDEHVAEGIRGIAGREGELGRRR